MNLTREQTIIEHRKMWNWIAEETLKRKTKMTKEDYFLEHPDLEIPKCAKCYCCDYSMRNGMHDCCKVCPIKWGNNDGDRCTILESGEINIFVIWDNSICYDELFTYEESAKLAKQIAELPEK